MKYVLSYLGWYATLVLSFFLMGYFTDAKVSYNTQFFIVCFFAAFLAMAVNGLVGKAMKK